MKLLALLGKLVLAAAVGAAGLAIYGKVRQQQAKSPAAAAAPGDKLSAAGFFLLDREAERNPRVTVMVAPGCPRAEAQRGRALHAALQQAGVPADMSDRLEVAFTDPADAERVQKFMESAGNPLVIVRGRAKGNPSLQDVLAEYNARK